MLWPDDQLLIRRDPWLPGLPILLDPEAFADSLRPHMPGVRLVSARPLYVRYKPGTSCLVSVQLQSDRGLTDLYAIAYPARESQKLRKDTANAAPSAIGPGAIVLEEHAVAVHVFPNDVRLEALRHLGDAEQRAELLRKLLPGQDALWHCAIARLAYKPHRRFVAMLSCEGQPRAVLKLYTRAGFEIAARNARLIESRQRLRVPRRIGRSTRHALAAYRWIDGPPLGDPASMDPGMLHRVGAALHAIHEQDASELPLVDHAAEARRLRTVATAVGLLMPEVRERLQLLARRLIDSYPRPRAIVTVHGDFHARQILITGRKIAILDLDEATRCSAAADIGNFIAHVHRHALSAGAPDAVVAGAAHALLNGYLDASGHAVDDEIPWHTAAALLRLAPHPFRAREPQWRQRTLAIIERSEQIANQLGALGVVVQPGSAPIEDRFNCGSDPKLRPFVSWALDLPFMESRLSATLAAGEAVRIERACVVRCKPQRRCLIEYDLLIGDAAQSQRRFAAIAKVRAKGADEPTFHLLQELRGLGFDEHAPDGVGVPEPIALIDEAGMWMQRKVEGTAATQRLRDHDAQRLAIRVAEAIVKLHRAGVRSQRQRRHTIDDELKILRDRLLEVALAHPHWASRLDTILAACAELAATVGRPVRACGIHRDFYADQVLVDGERLWLVDLDLYSEGDPALDVGNFIAHLMEQGLRENGDPGALEHIGQIIENRFIELNDESIRDRVRVYEMLTLARHIAISQRLPARRHLTTDLMALCERRFLRPRAA